MSFPKVVASMPLASSSFVVRVIQTTSETFAASVWDVKRGRITTGKSGLSETEAFTQMLRYAGYKLTVTEP